MATDPFAQFKAVQREGWALFAPLEAVTTIPAAALVELARIRPGESLLDAACGTGVVAVTAARRGAKVSALDLSPVLLEKARANAATAGVEVDFVDGDVEALPYPDATFDVVTSQFGHMFAPRPEVAVRELLRVLKKGGRLAFSTWPPELFVGRMFALTGKYAPLPPGASPPPLWGDPNVIRERLGGAVTDLSFFRDVIRFPALSPAHARRFVEATAGPVAKLVATLEAEAPAKLAAFRAEFEALAAEYLIGNALQQDFLMTRSVKI